MKITHTTYIFIAGIAVFCRVNQSVTWFEAQTFCRKKNLTLTSKRNASGNSYWTGFYKKTSHWIKIIGCYNSSSIQQYISRSTNFSISSPALCQEYCLQKDIYKFAIQGITCVCLSNEFNDNGGQLSPSKCGFMCDNCTLLTNECGGDSAYNVFYTDSTDLKIPSHCLSLQCQNDPRFVNTYCNQFLPPLCNIKPSDNRFMNDKLSNIWKNGMAFCKDTDNGFYLLGNITLLDAKSACTGFQNSGPGWIGVIKENVVKSDEGQFIDKPYRAFFNTCQTCGFKIQAQLCEYIHCNQSLTSKIFCSENAIVQQQETKGNISVLYVMHAKKIVKVARDTLVSDNFSS